MSTATGTRLLCPRCRRHRRPALSICPRCGTRLRQPAASPPALGALVDRRYVRLAPVGTGGMSVVYRAFDTRRRRPVALKVVDPQMARRPDAIARFFGEVRALQRVHHPGVVRAFHAGCSPEGWLYLAMEPVQGVCLATVVRRDGGLSVREALPLAEQAIAALEAVHRAGVLHLDLKPENFILMPGRRLKLLDFGIARLVGASDPRAERSVAPGPEVTRSLCGTPQYVSPERAAGAAVGPASDLYGFGVLLFEMIAGRPPFDGSVAVEVLRQHLIRPPPSLQQAAPRPVPEALDALVARLLAKRPQARPTSAAEVARALRRIRADVEAARPAAAPAPEMLAARPTLPVASDEARPTVPDLDQADEPTATFWIRPCPACRALNDASAPRCVQCGAPASRPSPQTGARAAASEARAPHAHAVPPPLPHDVRPRVAVRRWAALVVRLAPAHPGDQAWRTDLAAVVERWHARVAAAGGLPAATPSDDVLAVVFGVEEAAHMPHPVLAATRIAADLIAAVRTLGGRVVVRCGLAAAEVHLPAAAHRPTDPRRLADLVAGSDLGLAHRLAALASPGTLLACEQALAPLRGHLPLPRVARIRVRGHGAAVAVHRIAVDALDQARAPCSDRTGDGPRTTRVAPCDASAAAAVPTGG